MDTQALFASAIALEDLGRVEEALERYGRVLSQTPHMEDALHNRGLLLARLGRLREAERSHQEYLTAYPGSRRARLNLVDVLLAQSRYGDAASELDIVIAKDPRDIPALVKSGMALAALGRFDSARDAFSAARSYDAAVLEQHVRHVAPGSDVDVVLSPESIFLWRRYVAQGICDWSGWADYLAEFRSAISQPGVELDAALSFVAFHLPLSASERHLTARRIAYGIERKTHALPPPPASGQSKIRVGILSPDFREHLNAYLLLPLFELLDRRRFELYAYSLTPDDGSDIVRRLKKSAEGFVDLTTMPDTVAASRIRQDGIDLLVDTGGHSAGGRFAITAQRPARIQVMYLGFAGSIGSTRVDYAIVDRVVAPQSSEEWTEAPAYLPSTYYLYDFRVDAPDVVLSRCDYGLPEEAFVYCAFHKAEKITPDVFDTWMRILGSAENSVMWFLALPTSAIANLRSAAETRGVNPSRLHFAPFDPRTRYLARQRLGDLLLDCFHHNAMTTACDALAAGLPVLTVKGQSMASRAGESLLRAAGLPELVASDPEAFLRQAVQLARDRRQLGELRRKLTANRYSAPLFDTAARVRQLEAAFGQMHQRALRGDAPTSFDIADR